ncbi:MAG: thioredoxin family protein [Paludibacter sp.]|nr:thioredoxin family protein [Bacteroidales bacterium]MCM1068867.1 thioredoxin family protein [Prevotella sp.]MCM1353128.1 thioredoxin family protein [Bacteroides sp.]MCM1442450.1 thioredoxin family protein [Muribaculum sp.]MCM1481293.1 thioredoxin family protein [Paludibacter sp.]
MKRKYSLILLLCLSASWMQAQLVEPVRWTSDRVQETDTTAVVTLRAQIEDGWHLYGMDIAEGGPKATTIRLANAELIESPVASVMPKLSYDENFGMLLSFFDEEVVFAVQCRATPDETIVGSVEYMACNDEQCLPPTVYEFNLTNAVLSSPSVLATSDRGLLWIFLMGLLAGFLAIFTPCVWPIIPMTVSFFMKRSTGRNGLRDALLYGVAIVIIYVGLGLLVTLLFGASALNSFSTNAVVNLFFFALLIVFAVSFMGAFELTLPSSWTTKIDAKATATTGFLSILLMAFTLVLVSFSCTGPIIGTLLVEAAGRSILAPTVGMLGFALALALPFTLFALFPKWLKSVPKSGGWMNTFKVTLAFLELALSLKFFSVADLAYGWHLLDREVFLSIWIVLFFLLGLYLLGLIRFRNDEAVSSISVFRFACAVLSLAFAVYLLPGLWGAPLKAVSAFAPPLSTQDYVLTQRGAASSTTIETGAFEDGLALAAENGRPLLVDFSGYGCVNCRKMGAKVLADERVQQRLQHYVVVTLMVDDKTRLPQPLTVVENGKSIKLTTVGDRWSYLQRSRFGANAQPFLVQLNAQGEMIAEPCAYTDDVENFLQWLKY